MRSFTEGMLVLIIIFMAVLVIGQTSAPFGVLTKAGNLSNCQKPISGYNGICSVTDGIYISVNGAPYVKLIVP